MAKRSRTKKTTRKRTSAKAEPEAGNAKGKGTSPTKPPTSAQVAAHVAEEADITKKQARAAMTAIAAMMRDTLTSGGTFVLPGIARASIEERPATAARIGRHPITKQEIQVPAGEATRIVRVRVTRRLREEVLGEH